MLDDLVAGSPVQSFDVDPEVPDLDEAAGAPSAPPVRASYEVAAVHKALKVKALVDEFDLSCEVEAAFLSLDENLLAELLDEEQLFRQRLQRLHDSAARNKFCMQQVAWNMS